MRPTESSVMLMIENGMMITGIKSSEAKMLKNQKKKIVLTLPNQN